MKFWKFALAGIVLTISSSANAALIDFGEFTRDTDTGLEWLDLTESTGLSYNDVSSQFGAGGQFEGWAYASVVQIDSLFDSAGGTGPYDIQDKGFQQSSTAVSTLLAFWGTTAGDGFSLPFQSSFIIGTSPLPVNQHEVGLVALNLETNSIMTSSGFNSQADDFTHQAYGHALVRVVPIPAAVWLFGSGLIGLIGFSRRKK
jgi:hypothetical protein